MFSPKKNAFANKTPSKSNGIKTKSQKSGATNTFVQGLTLAIVIYFVIKWYMRRKKVKKDESAKLERKLVDGFVDERFEKVFLAFRSVLKTN
jgi:phosphotransferase system  glucose/maltose/N-acetylglucosamine-specific IIC component